MHKLYLLFLLLTVCSISSHANDKIIKIGTPFVKQYSKSQYKAGNQNWSIAFDKRGLLYAGNNDGLLMFDGTYWTLYKLPNSSTIRSVYVSNDDKIYVGGKSEFGYYTRNNSGRLIYTSLSAKITSKDILNNDEIWKIIDSKQGIIFHSFSKSYVYNNGKFNIITAKGEPFLFAHHVRDKIYLEQIPSGLHLLNQNQLSPIFNKDVLSGSNILCMLPLDNNKTLIGTSNNGLFLMDETGNINRWNTEISNQLEKYNLNNGIQILENYYAFGTIKNGIYIMDKTGRIIQHINKNNGLQNNTILTLQVDKQNNLWAGLDNGIDRIEINSPLYYYTDIKGEIGTVYTSKIFESKLYLGTNQGLYYTDWSNVLLNNTLDFKLIPNSSGHVLTLDIINNKLICGHNSGTFLIENAKFSKVSNYTGGYFHMPIYENKYVMQGNYTGLSLFEDQYNFKFIKQFDNIKEPILFGALHNQNQFWIGNSANLYLMEFDYTNHKVQTIYTTKNDNSLSKLTFNGIYSIENKLVFATNSGLFVYDEVLKKFSEYSDLNKKLGAYSFLNRVFKKDKNTYWLAKNDNIAIASFNSTGEVKIDSTSLLPLQNKMMKHYENVLNIDNEQYLIGLDYGFAIYNPNINVSKQKLFPPQISSIWNITSDQNKIIETSSIDIDYHANNIRIFFSSPNYTNSHIKYAYYLEGYNKEWSVADESTYKDFYNLPYGSYKFNVKSVNEDGDVSEVTQLIIHILTPWYYSFFAKIIYFLLGMLILYLIYKYYNKHIERKEFQLKKKILEKQKDEIAKNLEENERQIIKLKNLQLEKELEIKNRELSNAATNIIYKNEMLNKLNTELNNLKDKTENKLSTEQINRFTKLIDSIQNDNRDWDVFEKSFNDAHGNFFKKLKKEYPDLVPNDLKLCAYLRLNMSSKEIASLLNITTRGVEIRRYRLRKKLNLPTDKNLTEFLLEK